MPRLRSLGAILAGLCFAGPVGAESWYAGVKGGVNIAGSYGDDAHAEDTRTRFAGGGFAGVRFDAYSGVRLELLYVQKGDQTDFFVLDASGPPVESSTRIDYVEFPLLLVGTLPVVESLDLDVFIGPAFDLQVHATETDPDGSRFDIGTVISGFDFCGTAGAGARYHLPHFTLVADGRYTIGTLSIIDPSSVIDDTAPAPEIKNRGFSLLLGVEFPLRGR